ncbi:MAG: hypothetical protein FIA92_06505 [Chloroflexi bacterium]|nr:hypothetical protein [Chloroflexota bacterium]
MDGTIGPSGQSLGDVGAVSASQGRSRESRAAIAFTAGGLFALVIWLVIATSGMVPASVAPLFLLGLATPLVSLAVGHGIGRRVGWVLGAMAPLLVVLIVTGAIETIAALGANRINVPLGLILAAWAFGGAPERSAYPADARSALLVAVFVAAFALPVVLAA